MNYGLGSHFLLDCYGCLREKLKDVSFIHNLLDAFPAQISMTKVSSPNVFKYNGKNADDWGISGVVLIAESHISIHTFPEKDHAFIDIFSSKEFDTNLARDILMKALKATHHEENFLHNGREDNPDLPNVAGMVQDFASAPIVYH
ncbi:MAG: adenosylmethionine decarboxylase [bacterium]